MIEELVEEPIDATPIDNFTIPVDFLEYGSRQWHFLVEPLLHVESPFSGHQKLCPNCDRSIREHNGEKVVRQAWLFPWAFFDPGTVFWLTEGSYNSGKKIDSFLKLKRRLKSFCGL